MTKESKLNQPDATVWSAPSSEDVIGPVFFGKTVNGENYMEILCDLVVPQLRTKAVFDELFFQQDGASLHYALTVRVYPYKAFPQPWFGKRSLDLTSMDFSFWDVVKNKVYKMNPKKVNELKDYISEPFTGIDGDWNSCGTNVSECSEEV